MPKTKIVTPPHIQKAFDDLKAQGFDVKLKDPVVRTKKEKDAIKKSIKQALKEIADIDKKEEQLEKEMIRQTGGE